MKKYIVCKKCGFENLPGTQFCQRCGSKISLKFTDKIASSLAGTGQKGSSLAPLGAMAIEAQTEEHGKNSCSAETGSCNSSGKWRLVLPGLWGIQSKIFSLLQKLWPGLCGIPFIK